MPTWGGSRFKATISFINRANNLSSSHSQIRLNAMTDLFELIIDSGSYLGRRRYFHRDDT